MNLDSEEPSILVGTFADVVWIRVCEKGCFANSPRLRKIAEHIIREGYSQLVVDLEECPGMDSTFMGTLTGIALKLRQRPDGSLHVVNMAPRNLDSLRELGLQHIMELDEDGKSWEGHLEKLQGNSQNQPESDTRSERKEVMADAHAALCEANSDNMTRFQDVLEYLGDSTRKE